MTVTHNSGSPGQDDTASAQPSCTNGLWRVVCTLLGDAGKLTWSFAALGTLAVVMLFWRMRYLPGMNIADIGLVAFAVVAFSILMVTMVVAMLFLPTLVMQPWLNTDHPSDGAQDSEATDSTQSGLRPAIILSIGGGFAIAAVYFAFFTAIGQRNVWPAVTLFLIGLGALVVTMIFEAMPPATQDSATRPLGIGTRILAVACVYLFFIPVITWVMLGTHEAAKHLTTCQFVIACVVMVFAHYLLAATRHAPIRTRLVITFVITGFILLIAGTASEALDRAARVFRIGLMPDSSVVVGKDECRIAKAARIVNECTLLDGNGTELYELPHVMLLNRLGSHVVIADSKWTVREPTHSVALPNEKVLAWYATPRPRPAPAPSAPTAPVPTAPVQTPTSAKPEPRPKAVRRQAKAKSAPAC